MRTTRPATRRTATALWMLAVATGAVPAVSAGPPTETATRPTSGTEATAPGLAVFRIDTNHSGVGFKIRHFLTKVPGEFQRFSGTVHWDPADLRAMQVEAEIEAASIHTRHEKRDAHLRSEDFFWVEEHPAITFRSTGVDEVDGDRVRLKGDLTIRGVTRPVVLDVEVLGVAPGYRGERRAGFEVRTTVNRKDFGIVWNRVFDHGGAMLGDDVEIAIQIEAFEPPPEEGDKS